MKRVLKFLEKQSTPVSFEDIRSGTGRREGDVRDALGALLNRQAIRMRPLGVSIGWRDHSGYRGDVTIGYEVIR